MDVFLDRYVFYVVLVLLSVGLYGMLAMGNLAKKLVGMVIFSSATFLFFINGAILEGATAPVIDPAIGSDPAATVIPWIRSAAATAVATGASRATSDRLPAIMRMSCS